MQGSSVLQKNTNTQRTNMMKGRNPDRINSFEFSNNLVIASLLLLKNMWFSELISVQQGRYILSKRNNS